MKKVETLFGDSDSEGYYEEIIIPEGLEAIMENGRIILRRKETKDEKIRKNCIHFLELQKRYHASTVEIDECIAWFEKQSKQKQETNYPKFDFDDILALQCCMETVKKVQEDKELYEKLKDLHSRVYDAYHLEKQGEQKPADKVEIDFKIGDWIVENGVDRTPIQITAFEWDNGVITKVEFNNDAEMYIELLKYYHKWTIQEARDGDVLVSEYNKPFIYNGKHTSDSIGAHCGIDIHDQFTISITECDWTIHNVKPATKEQSDLLFQEMKKEGWELDAEKKKLKRMQKAKWSEEDSIAIDNCCLLIAAADDSYEKSFKDDCIHYLQNLKQRMTNDKGR